MIVLDTQVAVWMTTERGKLSSVAQEVLRASSRREAEVALASSSLWEIAMIFTHGRIELPASLSDFLGYMEKLFVILPINAAIAERSMQFSKAFPNDPTDRIIGATAIVYGAKLVTADWAIRKSGEVECVW